MKKEILEHSIYDKLFVNERSTAKKVAEEFSSKILPRKSGLPKVLEFSHNIENHESKFFKVSQKECPSCKERGRTTHITNPRIDNDKTWVAKCHKCGTAINFFTPTPLQRFILNCGYPVINVIAGYGSGKTEFDMWHAARRAILIDGSKIMIAGGSKEGIAQAKGFFEGHFAAPWKHTKEKAGDFVVQNGEKWKLKNGSEIRWMDVSGGKVEKFRSWELDLVIMVEASADAFYAGGKESFWSEISKRMRNSVANVVARDEEHETFDYLTRDGKKTPYVHGSIHQIILESNPKNSDIIQEVFNKSEVLVLTEKVANKEKIVERFIKRYDSELNANSGILSILASSNDNPMLTEKYITDAFPPGTDPAYIRRMRDADLSANEGQVYSDAQDCAREPLSWAELKTADKIYHVHDPGITDPAGNIWAAMWKNYQNLGRPKVRIFKGYRTKGGTSHEGNSLSETIERWNATEIELGLAQYNPANNSISRFYLDHTGKKKKVIRIADSAMWKSEKSKEVNIQEHITEADKYRKYGYDFKEALKGANSIEWGIKLVDNYIKNDVLEWDITQEDIEQEFIKYEYITDSNGKLKPKDKDNHIMDPIRYLIVEIDAELNETGDAPVMAGQDADRAREAFERRKLSRSRREKEEDTLVEMGIISRTEFLEQQNRLRKKFGKKTGF